MRVRVLRVLYVSGEDDGQCDRAERHHEPCEPIDARESRATRLAGNDEHGGAGTPGKDEANERPGRPVAAVDRYRWGMRLSALFALAALAEMMVFLWIGTRIGFGWALGIALVTAILGSYLVRRAGMTVWRRFRRRLDHGELPGRELAHGAAVLVAGALLISPGFMTDLAGFLLLVPAVRDFAYRKLSSRVSSRIGVFSTDRAVHGQVIDVDEVD